MIGVTRGVHREESTLTVILYDASNDLALAVVVHNTTPRFFDAEMIVSIDIVCRVEVGDVESIVIH